MFELTILGTGSMVPTKERHPQAFYLEYKGEGILIDCGEGCQRQMRKQKIGPSKIKKIFISHWHGDHVAGLIGLIQTMSNSDYVGTLHIYGPAESKWRFQKFMEATIWENTMDIEVHELTPTGVEYVLHGDGYEILCAPADHGIPCIAYAFKEEDRIRVDMATVKRLGIPEGPLVGKLSRGQEVEFEGKPVSPEDVTYKVTGKKVVFIPDTQPADVLYDLAQDADMLICESPFGNQHQENAYRAKHMTARWAAEIASRAEVGKLVLTHFSQRYPSVQFLVDEARDVFPETEAAFDLMKISF